jgi:hypothetical protein
VYYIVGANLLRHKIRRNPHDDNEPCIPGKEGQIYAYTAREKNMKQTSLFLRLEQFDKLADPSRVTGAPVAELIRRAIDAYFE